MFLLTNVLFIIIIQFVHIFADSIFFIFNYLDALIRLNTNDSFINFYCFFWTSFWYLPLFSNILLVFIYFYKKNNFNIFPFTITVLLIFYSHACIYLHVTNYLTIFYNSNLNNFNFFLFNNINKYHPFLFYISSCFFLILFSLVDNIFSHSFCFFNKENCAKVIKFFLTYSFFFITLSLSLGSWWALQEGTWGGWWNWDSSEVFGLLIFLSVLTLLHTYLHATNLIKLLFSLKIYTILISVTYFFIQLNFDLVSHNFGIKFFFFFNNDFFFIELLLLIFLHLFINLIGWSKIRSQLFIHLCQLSYEISLKNLFIFFFKTLGFLTLYKYYLISFGFLWNYLLWNFINLNLINVEIGANFIPLLFIPLLFIFLNRSALFAYFFIPLLMSYHHLIFFNILYILNNINLLFMLHAIFLNFIITNAVSLKLNLGYWLVTYNYTPTIYYKIQAFSNFFFTCDAGFIEQINHNTCYTYKSFPNWNTFFLLNFFHNTNLTFTNTTSSCYNLINLSSANYTLNIYIEVLFICALLLWLTCLVLVKMKYDNKITYHFY